MKTHLIPALLAALCLTGIESRAQLGFGTSFSPFHTTQSAVRDATGLRSTSTQYRFTLDNSFGTPFFLNNITFTPTVNWHPDIDLAFDSTDGFNHNFNGSFYAFGTLINGGDVFNSEGFLRRFGTVAPTVTAGLYEFDVNFLGGLDGESFDVLGTIRYELEVVERIDLTLGGATVPGVITAGQGTTARMTVQNDMTARSFVSTTWYISGGGFVNGTNSLAHDQFVGNWFDQTIAPGDSRTDDHTTWTSTAGTEPGTYTASDIGVIGGLYNGDQHSWSINSPQPSVVVEAVPEPSTWALLVLGASGLCLRFRRGAS